MFAEKIEKEDLSALPVKSFEGEIVLIEREEDLEPHIPYLFQQEYVGFDTETKPSFKKGVINTVALLQLATEEKAFLIRLNKLNMPDALKRLLEDDQILKIGVAVKNDLQPLNRLFSIKANGFVDLQEYSEEFEIQDNALTKLCGIVLGFNISKAQRLSNWENETLSPAQQKYAATDAWVCVKIYNEFKKIDN